MPVNFSEQTLKEYSDFLAAGTPSPGGGSAAAMTAVLGVSLGEMVANINAKKIKSNPDHQESKLRAQELSVIRRQLLDLVTKDAQVFEKLSKYWKDKSPLLQDALKKGAETPLEVCRLIFRSLAISINEIPVTSVHLISDLSESGVILRAAFRSALFNVEINLKQIEDTEFNGSVMQEVGKMKDEIFRLSEILESSFEEKQT